MPTVEEFWEIISTVPPGADVEPWLRKEMESWGTRIPTREEVTKVRDDAAHTAAAPDFLITLLNVMVTDYHKFINIPVKLTVSTK